MTDITVYQDQQAKLMVTWKGQSGDFPDPVLFDATDMEIKSFVEEAVRSGSIAGIDQDASCDLEDFVVDRFPPTEEVPFARLICRPKTPFGKY